MQRKSAIFCRFVFATENSHLNIFLTSFYYIEYSNYKGKYTEVHGHGNNLQMWISNRS